MKMLDSDTDIEQSTEGFEKANLELPEPVSVISSFTFLNPLRF